MFERCGFGVLAYISMHLTANLSWHHHRVFNTAAGGNADFPRRQGKQALAIVFPEGREDVVLCLLENPTLQTIHDS